MLEPIRARLASSFSRNGISEAATETSWFGDTSIISTSSGGTIWNSPPLRADTASLRYLPSLSMGAFAWAIASFSSSRAERYLISSVTLPSRTTRYGVSMNPNSLTRA